MATFREWLHAEAEAYCRGMPQLRRNDAVA
jgi:hypothetical protein